MKWMWIAPNPDEFISGGNIYNDKIIQALRLLKDEAHTLSIYQYSSQMVGPGDIVIWDTIYINELGKLEMFPCPNIFLLVHMLNEAVLIALPDILKKIRGCIVPSTWAAHQLSLTGVHSSQIVVIEPGMAKMPVKSQSHSIQEKLQLIQIANLVPEKGHEAMLKAFQQHMARSHDFVLDLYGDDRINTPWAQYILTLIEEMKGTSVVRFKGRIPHSKIGETLNTYHALLSVSPQESFGMAIQEAISFGLPVLAIRGGNISSLVKHGENGYLFDNVNQVVTWLAQPLKEQMELLTQLNMPDYTESNFRGWDQQATLLRSAIWKLCC